MADDTTLLDALDHIMRVARNTLQPTKRLDWIAKRAEYAIAGKEWSRDVALEPNMRVQHLQNENAKLLEFVGLVLGDHRDGMGDVDGGSVQDWAVKCGLLEERTMTEPCSEERCECASVTSFPTECYFATPLGMRAMEVAKPQEKTDAEG